MTSTRGTARFFVTLALSCALFLGALAATVRAQSAVATTHGARVLVLEPTGDARLARQLGTSVRERASAALTGRGLVPARGPSGCADPECASELLSTDAADWALAIALWGRGARCERVAMTLVDADGVAHGGEVAVTGDDVPAAVDAALAMALDHAASGGAQVLRVTGAPAGATITLDRIPWGAVPHEDRVPHGEHALAVSADGFVTDRRTVTIGTEPVTVEVALTRVPTETLPSAVPAPTPAAAPTTSSPGSGGGDPLLLGIGAGVAGAGLLLLGVGLYGALAPDSGMPMPPDFTYERASIEGAGVWLGVGAAALTTGLVLVIVGATSGPSGSASADDPPEESP